MLVLMSHGTSGDIILGSDGAPVYLAEVRDYLSPVHFRAMAGKPKFMIVQACSGGTTKLYTAY